MLHCIANVEQFLFPNSLLVLFLTVPVISHALISRGDILKSNYFQSKIYRDFLSHVHIYTAYTLEGTIVKLKVFQCFSFAWLQ